MYPIYIPSKARSNASYVAKLLQKEEIPFTMVIEPQDFKDYSKIWGEDKLFVMPKDNQGVDYTRNACKDESIRRGELWHWQIDDNVQAFYTVENKKAVKSTAKHVLEKAESFVDKFSNIGIAGPAQNSFVYSRNGNFGINRQCVSVFMINNGLPLRWRGQVASDTDYSMQVLHYDDRKWCTLLIYALVFSKPSQNSMPGGMTPIRAVEETRKQAAQQLVKAWPGAFKMKVVPDKYLGRRYRIMPSRIWGTFTQRPRLK